MSNEKAPESIEGTLVVPKGARFAIVAVEPKVGAEDLLVPVGTLGDDRDGVTVGRDRDRGIAYRVKEFVESEFGLRLVGGERLAQNDKGEQNKS